MNNSANKHRTNINVENVEEKTVLNEEIQRTGYISVEEGRRITREMIRKVYETNRKI